MDITTASSSLPSQDQLAFKSSQADDGKAPVDTHKTNRPSSYQPSIIHVNVNTFKHPKNTANLAKQVDRGSTCSVSSSQIQASAYLSDSETVGMPVDDAHLQDLDGPHSTKPTSHTSTATPPESNKHAHPPIAPTPPVVLPLELAAPLSQLQPGAEPTSLTSNIVASSAISILSASGTLVSHEVQGRHSSSTSTSHPAHPLSRTTTVHTLAVSPAPSFDPQQFKTITQKLTSLTEQFEALNDQLLDALTSFDESRLGLGFASAGQNLCLTVEPTSQFEPSSSIDLEIERRAVAQSLVELILTSWSRLAGPGDPTGSSRQPPIQKPTRLNKLQIKATMHLKDTIVALWSAQSNFQDRAQLVLDIFEVNTWFGFSEL